MALPSGARPMGVHAGFTVAGRVWAAHSIRNKDGCQLSGAHALKMQMWMRCVQSLKPGKR
ncbi:hypothetical protein VARIO8X_130159 [Burkholderiales bacterium 8X]|nr:hypothetical protein VARIO8X_130159 [Burkholderiales bacterium 8X]